VLIDEEIAKVDDGEYVGYESRIYAVVLRARTSSACSSPVRVRRTSRSTLT
jgi:hypothetical protein